MESTTYPKTSPAAAFTLGILTLGIYLYIWAYRNAVVFLQRNDGGNIRFLRAKALRRALFMPIWVGLLAYDVFKSKAKAATVTAIYWAICLVGLSIAWVGRPISGDTPAETFSRGPVIAHIIAAVIILFISAATASFIQSGINKM
jgi:hypothetical protein